MKLVSVQIQNFRSVDDSDEFSVDDTTCLVGKNEAGKTALLEALEAVNPWDNEEAVFDKIRDYPRRYLNEYEDRHGDGEAVVATTKWILSDDDVGAVEAEFGEECLTGQEVILKKCYEQKGTTWTVPFNEGKAVAFLIVEANFNAAEKAGLDKYNDASTLYEHLAALEERTAKQEALHAKLKGYRKQRAMLRAIDILNERMPKFLYLSHYHRMSGRVSIEQLNQDQQKGELDEGDTVFQEFLDFAGTDIDELKSMKQFEHLHAKVEAASNQITDRIFEYWSQNQSLEFEFEIHGGHPDDEPPLNTGTVMEARCIMPFTE